MPGDCRIVFIFFVCLFAAKSMYVIVNRTAISSPTGDSWLSLFRRFIVCGHRLSFMRLINVPIFSVAHDFIAWKIYDQNKPSIRKIYANDCVWSVNGTECGNSIQLTSWHRWQMEQHKHTHGNNRAWSENDYALARARRDQVCQY